MPSLCSRRRNFPASASRDVTLAALGLGLGSDRAKLPLQQDLLHEGDAQERCCLLAFELYSSYFIRKLLKNPLSPARLANFYRKVVRQVRHARCNCEGSWFSHRSTPATSREFNYLWTAGSRKFRWFMLSHNLSSHRFATKEYFRQKAARSALGRLTPHRIIFTGQSSVQISRCADQ